MPAKHVAIQRAWRGNGNGSGEGNSRPIMLAIAGDSASGKTTLTKGLVEALGPERITAICVDDYHKFDRVERKEKPFTPLHPECNYVDIMEQHLQLLALGHPILKPVYNHDDGTLGRPVLVEPREFVIVEGLLPLYTKLARACFDATVYLDPPESIRYKWKIKRDTSKRGYTEEQVLADLEKREPESAEFIRPQRSHANIVVRFSPIQERGESDADPPSATLLLRPTIPHPDLSRIVGEDVREALHLKLLRDDDGKPVDALHIHSYAKPEMMRKVEEAIWDELGVHEPVPDTLGAIDGERSEPLALTQLILLFHLIQAKQEVKAGVS
ncbi:MAG TPA: phosphoribulokinase [Acidimicrobiales bacterium]|nr:phosphoribulokinase [Acidimicrobiales bacterium]